MATDGNDELGKAETLVQFKDSLGVDIGFAGSGFHFHGKLLLFQTVRQRQGIAFLHSPHVGEHGFIINKQSIADAVLRFQQCRTIITNKRKGGSLFLLADEQIGHGVDCGGLEGLIDEFEFHAPFPFLRASIFLNSRSDSTKSFSTSVGSARS